jgi:type I restriction enzyme, R subunit
MNKKQLSERDICTKFITPSLRQAGWDEITQLREEVSFTKGRIIVRGKLVTRGKAKRADYILLLQAKHPSRSDRGQGQQLQRRRRLAAGAWLR